MDSKMLRSAAIAAIVAVSTLAGVAYAVESPAAAPGPATSGAAALSSSSMVAAVLCPAVALLFANLRH
ncbi:hypothetical protein D1007_09136 [Hordeum vulgare]|uniref:Predicted protein n=1 Tax=Hordeum vulgare subsp. vulgare TaxID=112509 RepID=F2E7Y7_HORVV|nr:hypothetical protein D1007_09136 [Hordeum vulgare]BAK03459.1 predicted protein [Hordeum vulgare subsp. vulgare]